MARRLGMLGGTFDPPHIGHLIVAQDVCEALALDRLLIVPAARPPHREPVLPAPERLAIAKRAFAGDSRFEVSPVECERPGPSYTVDTLAWIRRTLHPHELFCVIGSDQLRVIDTWHRYDEIVSLGQVAVMERGGEPVQAPAVDVAYAVVPVTRIDISGSQIRERLRRGLSIRYLVPENVREDVLDAWEACHVAPAEPN